MVRVGSGVFGCFFFWFGVVVLAVVAGLSGQRSVVFVPFLLFFFGGLC